jgi:predicted DNA-binding transcriptional regulator AlpA
MFINTKLNIEKIIASEASRLASKYNKDYLNHKDLIEITGLGRDNVRAMMKRSDFPLMTIGKRQVVSVVAFVTWMITNNEGGIYG